MRVSAPLAALVAVVPSVYGASCDPEGADEGVLPTEQVSSSFVFNLHAFSFENFGGREHGSLMTPESMERLFGKDKVCDPNQSGRCQLLPIPLEYMQAVNDSIEGGRCEGFAVLSGLASLGEVDLTPFGSPNARELNLNSDIGAELAYWFTTQYLRDVVPVTTQVMTGVEAVKFLNGEFSKPAHSMYRVGIARLDPDTQALAGGHAILATYVAPGEGEGQYVIGIYDNNHPDAERQILVDANADSWTYQASADPADPETVYAGDATNQNFLYVAPAEPREGVHPCTFCTAEGEEELAQVFGSASSSIVVVHPDGRVGEEGGLVDDHGEGHATPQFTAACHDCRDGVNVTIPHHPDEGTTIEIGQHVHAPTENGEVASINVHFFGRGFATSVEGSDVDIGETHTLFISGNGDTAILTSPTAEAADQALLAMAFDAEDGDQVFVEARMLGAETAEIQLDDALGDPTFSARGPNAAASAIVLVHSTLRDVTHQYSVELPLPPAGSATIVLAESEPAGNVTVLIDEDGDGATDETLLLPDLGIDP